MAVLIEAISVAIRQETLEAKYPGGIEGFVRDVPNQTFCADSYLARVGFMTPVDVEGYIRQLARVLTS
jgi:hypothetical protein